MHGVGHHFAQVGNLDYLPELIPAFIDDCKRMRFNASRGDFNTDLDGNTQTDGAELLIEASYSAGMKVLPVLYLKGRGAIIDAETTYHANYQAARGFAKNHPQIQYYEADNELDVKGKYINWANNVYGTHIDDSAFYMDQYRTLKSQVNGFIAGILSATPTARIGMNYGYIHYGLIKRLCIDGAKLYWAGLNAYNNEEYATDNYRKSCFGNLVNKMKYGLSAYVKEFYVTEMGFYPSGSNPYNLTQDGFIESMLPEVIAPNTNGYFYHEWMNNTKTRKGDEANLGMTEATKQLFRDGKG